MSGFTAEVLCEITWGPGPVTETPGATLGSTSASLDEADAFGASDSLPDRENEVLDEMERTEDGIGGTGGRRDEVSADSRRETKVALEAGRVRY